MTFTALRIDDLPLDQDLTDDATVGPDLAHAAHAYRSTPRALIWRNPSSDWQLLIVLLPLATRLSLMTNPIFGRLVRDWGMGIRFIGVDAEQSVYDFRELLDRPALDQAGQRAGALHRAVAGLGLDGQQPPTIRRWTRCSRCWRTTC